MPRKVAVVATDMEFFEDLYRRDRQKLINYATAILWKYGAGNMSVADRAEEVVQDAFCLAWKKRDDPTFREFPSQWMCKTVVYKVREALREDRKWVKCLTLLPEKMVVDEPWEMIDHLAGIVPKEDYDLLRKLYQEGYTYKELCAQLGVKKSALAMRISRSKERIRKNLQIF